MMLRNNKRPSHYTTKEKKNEKSLSLLSSTLEPHCHRATKHHTSQDAANPLCPLKVWQEYRRNVYLEPLQIVKVPTEKPIDSLYNISSKRTYLVDERLLTGWTRQWCAGNEPFPKYKLTSSRSVGIPPRTLGSMRQLSILDKKTILSGNNQRLSEDLAWISGLDSVGSLRAGDPYSKPKKRKNCTRDRFRKGLVSSTLKNTNVLPLVNGSKYIACDPCVLQSRLV
ncbi:uncharacterized protein [Heptranchias perlo]|uniref:uncharacterized protein n=1 Tax=Heptranchias perlo TaxID=212740 RepID=UPI00355A7304